MNAPAVSTQTEPAETAQPTRPQDAPKQPAKPKRGLGRGLGALIPTGKSAYQELPLSAVEVNPLQPRQHFDPDALATLAESIRQIGVLQPIVVRETGIVGRFELIAGERRWRAAHSAGQSTIPAVVRPADDETSLTHALIENVHRADLNPLEEAAAYRQLIDDFDVTHGELGRRMGRSRAAITNTLRLLSLPVSVQRCLMEGELSAGHARALLGCSDHTEMELLAERASEEGWSVRATEEAVRTAAAAGEDSAKPGDDGDTAPPAKPTPSEKPAGVIETEDVLATALQTEVEIQLGRRGGHISIRFADLDDLARLFRAISANSQVSLEG